MGNSQVVRKPQGFIPESRIQNPVTSDPIPHSKVVVARAGLELSTSAPPTAGTHHFDHSMTLAVITM
jgi:hypothetical protein